jgi:Fe2+ transport system protein FeoA
LLIAEEIVGYSIADMSVGQSAIIHHIDVSNYSTRMLTMGLIPGKIIKILRMQPWNGSIYLELDKHFLGIRREEASLIKIDFLN